MAGTGKRRSYLELPSWVPNFSCQPCTGVTVSQVESERSQASADSTSSTISIGVASTFLCFSGIEIDTLDQLFLHPSMAKYWGKYLIDVDKAPSWLLRLHDLRIDLQAGFTHLKARNTTHLCSSGSRTSTCISTVQPPQPDRNPDFKEILVQILLRRYSNRGSGVDIEPCKAYDAWSTITRRRSGRWKHFLSLFTTPSFPSLHTERQGAMFDDLSMRRKETRSSRPLI